MSGFHCEVPSLSPSCAVLCERNILTDVPGVCGTEASGPEAAVLFCKPVKTSQSSGKSKRGLAWSETVLGAVDSLKVRQTWRLCMKVGEDSMWV